MARKSLNRSLPAIATWVDVAQVPALGLARLHQLARPSLVESAFLVKGFFLVKDCAGLCRYIHPTS
jgi:hypothetical protein